MAQYAPDTEQEVLTALRRLNPWIENTEYTEDIVQLASLLLTNSTPISHKVRYEQRLAAQSRFAAGRSAWNAWAMDMLQVFKLAADNPPFVAVCDLLAQVDFSGQRFETDADFAALIFPGTTDFSGVEFEKSAWFNACSFKGDVSFERAVFHGVASFEGSSLSTSARFGLTSWARGAEFRNVWIDGRCDFSDASFDHAAWFVGARFADTSFAGARFGGAAGFARCHFAGPADFSGTQFGQSCSFEAAEFVSDASFAGAQSAGSAWLTETRFARQSRADLEGFAAHLQLDGAVGLVA
jgi:uncharacterized protein YjbI with pentapeptide repeats